MFPTANRATSNNGNILMPDLPPADFGRTQEPRGSPSNRVEQGCWNTPKRNTITQIHGSSVTFDYLKSENKMDLVSVDA